LSSPEKPYTHEMVIVHRVFRREAVMLQRFVTGTAPGDVARAVRVAEVIEEYRGALHHHHRIEDEMLWPLLHQRAAVHDDIVHRMEKQHARLDETLAAVEQSTPAYAETASEASRTELAGALTEHRSVLIEHLDDEERALLPLVAEHLSVPEWDAVGRRGLETVPRNKVMLALGAILEEATPQERKYFLGKAPVAGRVLWWAVGRHQYRRYVEELRGSRLG